MNGDQPMFFVSVCSSDRMTLPIFLMEPNTQYLCDLLFKYRGEGKYLLHEFAILPAEFQMIITLLGGLQLEDIVCLIQNEFLHRVGPQVRQFFRDPQSRFRSRAADDRSALWQSGFKRCLVRNPCDYDLLRQLIYDSPGFAVWQGQPKDYPYCSANPSFRLDAVDWMQPQLRPTLVPQT